jgi:hypothetical protein
MSEDYLVLSLSVRGRTSRENAVNEKQAKEAPQATHTFQFTLDDDDDDAAPILSEKQVTR